MKSTLYKRTMARQRVSQCRTPYRPRPEIQQDGALEQQAIRHGKENDGFLDEERARGVIAASAGNHAQAVAYHGKRLGIPVTIVMPEPTPSVKVTQTAGHGARVVLHGPMFDDAYARARELELAEGLFFFGIALDETSRATLAQHGQRAIDQL